jgi:hypothetical protein
MLAVAISVISPTITWALCASPAEDGRWRNLDGKGDPFYIDVKMVDCGDQILNGVPTTSRYTMQVWVRQSTGNFYGRPTVNATYQPWKGAQWLVGGVPTGGYLDHIWVHAVERNGQRQMHVLIKHESLDSKPSASSEYWFVRCVGAECQQSPNVVKSIGRVKTGGETKAGGPRRSICEAARSARARNSPAAPNLEAQCRALNP